MEGLEKLEKVQNTITFLRSIGVSDENPDSQRFLAHFALLLVQDCGLDITSKCQLVLENVSKMSAAFLSGAMQCERKGDSLIENTVKVYRDRQAVLYPALSTFGDIAMVGLDAMISSNSTLEDFCRSYFMFHKMEADEPQSIFRYLPFLSFTESFIYQLDRFNENLMHFPMHESPIMDTYVDGNKDPNLGVKSIKEIINDQFSQLLLVLKRHGLLTERISEELMRGEEYWELERKLCGALVKDHKISIEDVTRAIHLKSFDYRVLNLLLYQLRGEKVNELHMQFLSISELLVEISDDLFDYEDDIMKNNFNILRMFAKYYGAAAPIKLAKFISEAEENYDQLLKALGSELSCKYQKRCEEATKEGRKSGGGGPPLGTWHIPSPIEDEAWYRISLSSPAP